MLSEHHRRCGRPPVGVFSALNRRAKSSRGSLVDDLLVRFGLGPQDSFNLHSTGPVSLVLSLARSAWVGLAAGSLYLLFKLPHRQRMHFVVAAICPSQHWAVPCRTGSAAGHLPPF